MPYRPKTPCHHPGCPELVEAGRLYCEKHLPLHPEATRPAAKRGYNRRWQKARKSYLEAHPLCVQCAKQGKYVRATVVDHIIPHRGDEKLFWDQNNWQALCKNCHDTAERAKESGTEQNYNMIDGCVNNVPKKPRRIGGRWSVLDRLHIKQAERRQKDNAPQQEQERSRKS